MFTEELERDPVPVLRQRALLRVPRRRPFDVAAGTRLNPSAGKQVQRPTLSHPRRLPLYRHVVSRLPDDLRSRAKKQVFFRDVAGRPIWDPDVAAAAVAELAKLMALAGRDAGYWSLAEKATVAPLAS